MSSNSFVYPRRDDNSPYDSMSFQLSKIPPLNAKLYLALGAAACYKNPAGTRSKFRLLLLAFLGATESNRSFALFACSAVVELGWVPLSSWPLGNCEKTFSNSVLLLRLLGLIPACVGKECRISKGSALVTLVNPSTSTVFNGRPAENHELLRTTKHLAYSFLQVVFSLCY